MPVVGGLAAVVLELMPAAAHPSCGMKVYVPMKGSGVGGGVPLFRARTFGE